MANVRALNNPILSTKSITENGTYDAIDDNANGYSQVSVDVPSDPATIVSKTITANGTYNASSDNADGYDPVVVNVPGEHATIVSKTITANGTYNASSDSADGYDPVVVNVPGPTIVSKSITANGTYNASSDSADGYDPVVVNVPGANLGTKSITENGTYAASSDNLDGYSSVTVNVESEYTETSLWTNNSPSSDFAGQTVSLSSGISNYDYIKVNYCYSKNITTIDYVDAVPVDKFKTYKIDGTLGGMATISIINSSNQVFARVYSYSSDTAIQFGTARQLDTGTSNNTVLIPKTIVGCKFA